MARFRLHEFLGCDLGPSLLGYAQPQVDQLTQMESYAYTATEMLALPSAFDEAGRPRTKLDTTSTFVTSGEMEAVAQMILWLTHQKTTVPTTWLRAGLFELCVAGTNAMVQNYMDYSDDACMNLPAVKVTA